MHGIQKIIYSVKQKTENKVEEANEKSERYIRVDIFSPNQ